MITWTPGEPPAIEPGMMLHYEDGHVDLVGSQRYYQTGPVKAWAAVVPGYWIEWAADLANRKELGK